jgi:hypothetical protein
MCAITNIQITSFPDAKVEFGEVGASSKLKNVALPSSL